MSTTQVLPRSADHRRVVGAVIYCRISQDRDGTGLGVERQERECREHADRLGWAVEAVLVDNDLSASGKVQRPAYAELLAGLREGRWGGLLTFAQDRLTRSPRELEDLIDAIEAGRAQVASITGGSLDLGTPGGRAVARIVGALARSESEQKAARQKAKHREIAEAGKPSGGGRRAYGFERDGVTHRVDEAELLRKAAEDILAGGTLRRWAAETGLSRVGLKRALVSARAAGLREHNGKLYPAVWEPIVSPDDRLRLRALFGGGPAVAAPGVYLLSGCVECGRCGAVMHSTTQKRADGSRARRWACKACLRNGVLAEPLETLWRASAAVTLSFAGEFALEGAAADVDALRDIEERRTQLAEMFAAGEIGRAEWQAAKAALDARQADAVVPAVRTWRPFDDWHEATDAERNEILRRLRVRIVIAPGTKATRGLAGRVAGVRWEGA